ncbi:MAG: hypothetical protein WCS92_00030 [Candidatus Babeliales bacterium]|jgi:hypothetical protein
MKKLLAFVFAILALISVNLFAVEIRNVVDNGNGEYTIQRTSRGVDHTFHRGIDGSWIELCGGDLPPRQVSQSFAKTLDSSLAAYILGKNACQQPLPASQAPQPLEHPVEHPGVEQPVEDDDMGEGILGGEADEAAQDPDAASRLAARPEHKRDFSGNLAADGSQEGDLQPKRKIIIDYAEIGRLALALKQQQPAPVQAAPVVEVPAQPEPVRDPLVPAVGVQAVQPASVVEGQVLTLAQFKNHIAMLQHKDKKGEGQKDCFIQ